MELQYFGADSITLTTKKSVISIDPTSDIASLKPNNKKVNTVMATRPELAEGVSEDAFLVSSPGEYEFEDCSVKGVAAQPHTAASGDKSATIYRIMTPEVTILVVGHIDSKLNEDQLEAIGVIDVLVVPVGGNGYTLDAVGAASVVRALEPKMVIPVHSSDDSLKYSVPQSPTELFTKELGAPVAEDTPEKLKLKTLPETLMVQIVKQS